MTGEKILYISDLDGTLLSPDSHLSETSIRLLNEAIEKGALFSIATARTPATVSELMKEINMRIPMVVMTGAALWDKHSGQYSDVQYFTPEEVREICSAYTCEKEGGSFLYTLRDRDGGKKKMEIYHIGPLNDIERLFMEERIHSPFKRFFVPESGLSEVPEVVTDAVLFFGMRPNDIASKIKQKLEAIPHINPMAYHDWNGDEITEIEAFPSGATKAKAILRLKEKTGADKVVVFGDNLNDISMMKIADRSIAVKNALPEVKAVADEVIGSNAEDSVAKYILKDISK